MSAITSAPGDWIPGTARAWKRSKRNGKFTPLNESSRNLYAARDSHSRTMFADRIREETSVCISEASQS